MKKEIIQTLQHEITKIIDKNELIQKMNDFFEKKSDY